jgi:CP family cyanate transporter-like MFS transporter
VIGCGIALGNVLLPGLIKRDFPGQVAKLTGAYSLTMGVRGVGSALIVPLAQVSAGWHGALLMLMAFPLVACCSGCRSGVRNTLHGNGRRRAA